MSSCFQAVIVSRIIALVCRGAVLFVLLAVKSASRCLDLLCWWGNVAAAASDATPASRRLALFGDGLLWLRGLALVDFVS